MEIVKNQLSMFDGGGLQEHNSLPNEQPKVEITDEEPEEDDGEVKTQTKYPILGEEWITKFQNYLLYNHGGVGKFTNRRNYVIFTIGINIALRGGDLCKMKVKDFIGSDGDSLEAVKRREQKTKKVRELFYNDIVIEVAKKWVAAERLDADDYMFQSRNSAQPYLTRRSLNRIIRRAGEALGYPLPVGSHSLRKTAIRAMYEANKDKPYILVLLQRMLGHSSVLTTLRYMGFEDESVKGLYLNNTLGNVLL